MRKDLSLSLLSRGCGRFVSSNRNAGRHDGRLDVCFTPQDYYIWKSQDSLFHLPSRGGLLVEAEYVLPKTYSTRRGPLVLYSQDLVTIETSYRSEAKVKKKRVMQRNHPTRQVEQQLSTLKELTAAILSNRNNLLTCSRLSPPFFPSLRLPVAPHLHGPSSLSAHITRDRPSPENPAELNPQWPPAERNTEQLWNQPGGEEDEEEEQHRDRKRVRLDVFIQIPSKSRTPTPQMEPQPWVHYVAVTPEEEAQTYSDTSLQQTEPNQHRVEEEGLPAGPLPALAAGCSVNHEPNREKTDELRLEGPGSDDQHLPPIAESCGVVTSQTTQTRTQRDGRLKTGRVKSQQNLSLPLLFPRMKDEINVKQRRGGEKTEKQSVNKTSSRGGGGGGGVGGRLPSDRGSMILLDPEVGLPSCSARIKGPGKQSSRAFFQNLHDPCEPSRGSVRGVLPLELRDLQDSTYAGCLILGPDGEIMQISLYDNNNNPSQGEGDTQGQALQVMSAEGEELPWVIVLQPEDIHTHTDGAERPDADAAVCHGSHHSEDKMIDEVSNRVVDPPTLRETFSPSRRTEPVSASVIRRRRERAEAAERTRKRVSSDAKNKVVMPPVREEKPGGENSDEEEESLSHPPGEKLQFEGDPSCSEKTITLNEATTEEAVDGERKKARRRDAGEASVNQRRKDMKTVTSVRSEEKRTTRKERRLLQKKTGSDAQSTRSVKRGERTNREAAETSDVSSVRKADRRGVIEGVERNEEEEERGEIEREEEESTRRRRRGRLEQKELVVGHNEEEMDIEQKVEEESNLESMISPPATQKHATEQDSGSDAENRSARADKRSSVRSLNSLRSTTASPTPLSNRRPGRSAASSCEGAGPDSAVGLASSSSGVGLSSLHGRQSSCSIVMVTEERMMLNLVKPESSRSRQSQEEQQEEAAALKRAQQAERQRQEVERRRREEEEQRKQQEREQTEEWMKGELEEERRKRAEELRLRRQAEEEQRRKREEEEREQVRRVEGQRERERRKQEERRRQKERLQWLREEEEQRRKAELERLCLEEEQRQKEEHRKLQEMDDSERMEYLQRKEEENRRRTEEERRRTEEEVGVRAAEEVRLQAELLTRQGTLLHQQLACKRGLLLEAGGLEKSQGISRPWIYSYFTLLQVMGLNQTTAESMTPDDP